MGILYVGVVVESFEELEAAYVALADAGYSTSHAVSPENMEDSREEGHVFALCVDSERDILGVYANNYGPYVAKEWWKDTLLTSVENVVEVAKAIFPI